MNRIPASNDTEIRARSLHRRFREGEREHVVLDDVSLEVRRGETVALRGRSGWLRWDEPQTETWMVVAFEERVHSYAGDIVEPERVWPVDPERTVHRVDEFVARGLAEGWLEADDERISTEAADHREW